MLVLWLDRSPVYHRQLTRMYFVKTVQIWQCSSYWLTGQVGRVFPLSGNTFPHSLSLFSLIKCWREINVCCLLICIIIHCIIGWKDGGGGWGCWSTQNLNCGRLTLEPSVNRQLPEYTHKKVIQYLDAYNYLSYWMFCEHFSMSKSAMSNRCYSRPAGINNQRRSHTTVVFLGQLLQTQRRTWSMKIPVQTHFPQWKEMTVNWMNKIDLQILQLKACLKHCLSHVKIAIMHSCV